MFPCLLECGTGFSLPRLGLALVITLFGVLCVRSASAGVTHGASPESSRSVLCIPASVGILASLSSQCYGFFPSGAGPVLCLHIPGFRDAGVQLGSVSLWSSVYDHPPATVPTVSHLGLRRSRAFLLTRGFWGLALLSHPCPNPSLACFLFFTSLDSVE